MQGSTLERPPARSRGETETSLLDDASVKPSGEHDLTILPLYATPARSSVRSNSPRQAPSRPTRDDPALVEPFEWPAWLVKPLWGTLGRSRRLMAAGRWLGGPEPSARDRYEMIRPWRPLARIEGLLARWLAPLRSPLVLWPYLFLWLLGFALLMRKSQYSANTSAGPPSFISAQATYWYRNDGCGIDGSGCQPFSNASLAFRCSANALQTQLLNDRAVGDQELIFSSLVVGGGDALGTYRADSFICQAAIHHGLFSDSTGGCGVVNQVGSAVGYLSSFAHGINSTAFPSQFPSSFRFSSADGVTNCVDLHDSILAYNVVMLFALVFVLRPPPIYQFYGMAVTGFWHLGLVSLPLSAVSPAMASFIPTLFILYAVWRYSYRFCLPYFETASIEKTVLYLGPLWVGVLSEYTFDHIPIQRLLPEDIKKQPGGLVALIILVIVLAIIIINQLRIIRRTGWLPQYLVWYLTGAVAFLLLLAAPGFSFRLHHWLLALILLPGTAWPTRLNAIYQGVLLGLLVNDAALFGYDSILQTAAELIQDGPQNSALPAFANSTALWSWVPGAAATVGFAAIPSNLTSTWDGYSLIVDDVERYSGTATTFTIAASLLQAGIPHFLRLAYTNSGVAGDFTRAAVVAVNGTWTDPAPGPS